MEKNPDPYEEKREEVAETSEAPTEGAGADPSDETEGADK